MASSLCGGGGGAESKEEGAVSTQGSMPQYAQENSSTTGADPGLLSITTKKGCQQGIRKVLGFQVGGNSLKPLEDMNSIQHHMTVPTVRVGQGWTEAPTSGGSLPMF